VTNALADGIVPEQRTIAIEMVKTTDPPRPQIHRRASKEKGPVSKKKGGAKLDLLWIEWTLP
jgi:hypothetical protein